MTGGPLQKMLSHLEALRRTPAGTVIYEEIARLVQEHDALRAGLERTYSLLLHLLLEAYAREPTAEQITRLHAQLIRWRREESPPPPLEAAGGGEAGHSPERRINTSYRLHLDRKRDEIAKLQEALAKSVSEAIAQNREFGALLRIELEALQQAESAQEVENLRQILIGGIEELIQSQSLLDGKLHKTGDYLKLIKADSERLHEELNKIRLLSLTDEFTGLPNRRAFLRRLQDEIGRAHRYGTPLALALLDLDEFKAINDLYGHAAGDEVLRCYAQGVLATLRHHDMVARYGGEEFAVLLPNTAQAGALAALEKLRERTAGLVCEHQGRTLKLPSFSAGLAMYVPGESATELINRADKALYRAKNLGRNRIEIAAPPDAVESPPAPPPPDQLQEKGG
jgi:diguanylate cyclase (GGDEF)-like protein